MNTPNTTRKRRHDDTPQAPRQTKRTKRNTPNSPTHRSEKELLDHLDHIINKNCRDMNKGVKGTGCTNQLLSISYELWKPTQQLPVEWYSIVMPLKSEFFEKNTIHYKILRSIALNLDNYVKQYGPNFLNYFLFQLEESSITGIYTIMKGRNDGGDIKLDKELQGTPHYDGTLSNSSITNMINNRHSTATGGKKKTRKSKFSRRKTNNRKSHRTRKTHRKYTRKMKGGVNNDREKALQETYFKFS